MLLQLHVAWTVSHTHAHTHATNVAWKISYLKPRWSGSGWQFSFFPANFERIPPGMISISQETKAPPPSWRNVLNVLHLFDYLPELLADIWRLPPVTSGVDE